MRFLSMLLVTAALATAQSPLTTTFANNNGGAVGGGVYFTLTNTTAPAQDVNICQLSLNFGSAAGTAGTIDVFIHPTPGTSIPHTGFTNPAVSSGAAVAAGSGQPTVITLSPQLTIPAGASLGIGIRANGLAHAYTNGVGVYPPGNVYTTAELTLNAGQASNVFAAGGAFSSRVVNTSMSYFVGTGTCPPQGTVIPQGPGCDAKYRSIYQVLTRSAFDLNNGWLIFTPQPGHPTRTYGVEFIPNCPLIPPGPTAVVVPLTDDSQAPVGTLGLVVGSNCWVATGPGNSNAFTPTVPVFLNNPSEAWYSWKDLNPAIVGSGQVLYEEPGPGEALITYNGVFGFGTTNPYFIQYYFNNNNGQRRISWGQNPPTGPTDWLVGYSPGGPDANGGPTDLSNLVFPQVAYVHNVDQFPLTLAALNNPVQQATVATPFNVETRNIPTTALIHIGILGLQRPLVPLAVLGAPNCFLNASADILTANIGPFGPTFPWSPLTIPPGAPALWGQVFNVQSAILGTPKNPALGIGLLTSNGLKCTIGGY